MLQVRWLLSKWNCRRAWAMYSAASRSWMSRIFFRAYLPRKYTPVCGESSALSRRSLKFTRQCCMACCNPCGSKSTLLAKLAMWGSLLSVVTNGQWSSVSCAIWSSKLTLRRAIRPVTGANVFHLARTAVANLPPTKAPAKKNFLLWRFRKFHVDESIVGTMSCFQTKWKTTKLATLAGYVYFCMLFWQLQATCQIGVSDATFGWVDRCSCDPQQCLKKGPTHIIFRHSGVSTG